MTPTEIRRSPDSCRAAWPWVPRFVHLGQILVGPTGEVLRVSESGLDVVHQGGQPFLRSIAADPAPGKRGRP